MGENTRCNKSNQVVLLLKKYIILYINSCSHFSVWMLSEATVEPPSPSWILLGYGHPKMWMSAPPCQATQCRRNVVLGARPSGQVPSCFLNESNVENSLRTGISNQMLLMMQMFLHFFLGGGCTFLFVVMQKSELKLGAETPCRRLLEPSCRR